MAFLFSFFFLVVVVALRSEISEAAKPQVPAVYVFGDSTADVGNNDYLPNSTAKANFLPYGIDFPHSHPTGRFSDGYNGIDFMVKHLGFERSPPPYLSLTNKTRHQILKGLRGANFASGGSGILHTTGYNISIIMTKQIAYFSELKSSILQRLGADHTDYILSKSIFLISTGGNDVFAFFSQNSSPNNTEIETFVKLLVSDFSQQLQALYTLGARKFAVVDIPAIGCCPYARLLNPAGNGACLDGLNELVLALNNAVKALFSELSSKMAGMKYSIGSSYNLVLSLVNHPDRVGYKEVAAACCGSGKLNAQSSCRPNATYCSDRNKHLFWDSIHPTHATAKMAGLAFYDGSQNFASPINLKQLAAAANA